MYGFVIWVIRELTCFLGIWVSAVMHACVCVGEIDDACLI
jgi:hypothetical protein